jgi:peroxiredoxin Q/BCP
MAQILAIGTPAPEFSLPGSDGKDTALKDLLGRGPIVLFFYPKDDTPGCTTEVCNFRDSYEAFNEAGAVVVGISSDSVESHKKFVSKHSLQFLLLSDKGATVRSSFGVPKTLGLLPGRVTYVLDAKGVVRHAFNSQFSPAKHIQEALGIVRELAKKAS